MDSERMLRLLELAGINAIRGADCLNHEFLREHEITVDECGELSALIGRAVLGYARSCEESRLIMDTKAVHNDPVSRTKALRSLRFVQQHRQRSHNYGAQAASLERADLEHG